MTRWVEAARLHQLRRGLYTLAPPFQKIQPHPFFVANRMVRGSYVSLQSALAHYGLIPEYVPVTRSGAYDLIWYLSDPSWPAPNLILLNNVLRQSDWQGPAPTDATWRDLVRERVEIFEWERIIADV